MAFIDVSTLDPGSTVVVATGNTHKTAEISAILGGRALPGFEDIRFVALSELGDFEMPEEDGATFYDNALIKARAALASTGLEMAIADDSGLVVDALDGAPGVYSARWAGVHGDDQANNEKLLSELANVPEGERTAHFHASVVLVDGAGTVFAGEGNCPGRIGFEPRGTNGFGYDPLFLPDATPGKTMGELEPDEKNMISHRAQALRSLLGRITLAS